MINFFDVVSEYISFIETNTYSSCEALSDQEMKAYGLIISGVNADLLTKQQNFELRVRLYDVVEAQKELLVWKSLLLKKQPKHVKTHRKALKN